MDDLIKRQDAQMAVQDHYNKDHGFRSYEDGQRMLNRINALPSTQKTGKWIHREDMDFIDQNKVQHIHLMCENCGLIHDFFDGHTGQYKYCPNCGTRMECEKDG